jgi:hypothetical protein
MSLLKFKKGDGVRFVFNNNRGRVVENKIIDNNKQCLVEFVNNNSDYIIEEYLEHIDLTDVDLQKIEKNTEN